MKDWGKYNVSSERATTAHAYPAASMRCMRFLKLGENVPLGIIAGAAIMLALAFVANLFNVPNPDMVLVMGLVFCAAMFGYPGGITGAIVMAAYTFAFFSTGNDFVTFTDQNIQMVVVSLVGIVIVTLLVSSLHRIVTQAFKQLEGDNRLLKEASIVDPLTGARNRLGLRRDFPDYCNCEMHVMMIDIDNFKNLNDSYGHQVGDTVLTEFSRILISLFGQNHVYRYGGDEFLVLYPEISEAEFACKTAAFSNQLETLSVRGCDEAILVSAGYVYGASFKQEGLRQMIGRADAVMYSAKNTGKNRIVGLAFSPDETSTANFDHGHTCRIGQLRNTSRASSPANSPICANGKAFPRVMDV